MSFGSGEGTSIVGAPAGHGSINPSTKQANEDGDLSENVSLWLSV
jgi:hypothetical protein